MPKKAEHLSESLASSGLCGFDINELANNLHAIIRCIGTKEFHLSFDGITLLLLFAARDSCIENGWLHNGPSLFLGILYFLLFRPTGLHRLACDLSPAFSGERFCALKAAGPPLLPEEL
jgi:hypothetical protein